TRTADRCELPAPCIRPEADAGSGLAARTAEYRTDPWYRQRFVETSAKWLSPRPDPACADISSCVYESIRARARCAGWPCAKRGDRTLVSDGLPQRWAASGAESRLVARSQERFCAGNGDGHDYVRATRRAPAVESGAAIFAPWAPLWRRL